MEDFSPGPSGEDKSGVAALGPGAGSVSAGSAVSAARTRRVGPSAAATSSEQVAPVEEAAAAEQATSAGQSESQAVRESFDQALFILEAEYRLQAVADAQRVLHLYQLLQAAREHSDLFASTTTAGGRTEEWVRRSLVWELSAAFHQSERKVMFLLDEAEALCEDFPATLDCLASGEISYQHAKTILTEGTGLDEKARGEFEKEVLPVARQTTPPQFRKSARVIREGLHPEDATRRKEEAVSFRHVQSWEDTNGMAWL